MLRDRSTAVSALTANIGLGWHRCAVQACSLTRCDILNVSLNVGGRKKILYLCIYINVILNIQLDELTA